MRSLSYLSVLRGSILFALAIFSLGIIVGLRAAFQSEDLAMKVLDDLKQSLSPILELSLWQLFLFVFANNALKSLLFMAAGLLFGIAPVLFLFGNGFVLGVLFAVAYAEHSLFLAILGILPHGIFEISAILIAGAIGINLGMALIKKIMHKEISLRTELSTGLKFFLKVIFPLLLFAAVIEIFLTPLVLRLLE